MIITNMEILIKEEFDKDKFIIKDRNITIFNNGELLHCALPSIVCTKIEIMNGLGIVFYLQNEIIKIINNSIIKVEIYKDTILVYRNIPMLSNRVILNIDINKKHQLERRNFNIGDKVFSYDIKQYSNGQWDEESILLSLLPYLKKTLQENENISFNDCIKDNQVLELIQLEIVEKISDDIYKLKPVIPSELLPDVSYYSVSASIYTFESLIETYKNCFSRK